LKSTRKDPGLILKDERPRPETPEPDEHRETLERLEDEEDLKVLARMRKKPLTFRRLEGFLRAYAPHA